MSRRASLPGADELFRRTSSQKRPQQQEDRSTKLQVAQTETASTPVRGPRHEEKITVYCTRDDLMSLERARLELRAEHGIGADRGRIVRAALGYVLEDFEARGADSVLIRRLSS